MTLDERLRSASRSVREVTLAVQPDPALAHKRVGRGRALRAGTVAALTVLILVGGVAGWLSGRVTVEQQDVGTEDPEEALDVDDIEDQVDPEPEPQDQDDPQPPDPPAPAVLVPAGPQDGGNSQQLPVSVEPDSDLVEGQTVTVRGTGFTPGVSVVGTQCWFTPQDRNVEFCNTGDITLGSTTPDGTLELTMQVSQIISVGAGVFDCTESTAEGGCTIAVANLANYDESGGAAIFFTPGDGVAPPSFTITRNEDLADGQEIVVQGEGFQPGETVRLVQCVIGGSWSYDACFGINDVFQTVADADGRISTTLTTQRLLLTRDGYTDCATEGFGCRLVAGASQRAGTPVLNYSGTEPTPEGPSFSAAPAAGLVEGQTILVSGSGLQRQEVMVIQCAGGEDEFACASYIELPVESATEGIPALIREGVRAPVSEGRFDAEITVARVLVTVGREGPSEIDCAALSSTCVAMIFTADGFIPLGEVSLQFDPDGPLPGEN